MRIVNTSQKCYFFYFRLQISFKFASGEIFGYKFELIKLINYYYYNNLSRTIKQFSVFMKKPSSDYDTS